MKFPDPDSPEKPSDESTSEAKRIYGRQLAIDALLRASANVQIKGRGELEAPIPKARVGRFSNTQRSAVYAIAASLAILLAFVGLYLGDFVQGTQVSNEKPLAANVLMVDSITGIAYLSSNENARGKSIEAGSILLPDSILRTDGLSQVTLRYPDETTLEVGANTILENVLPKDESQSKQLRLKAGTLLVEARPQPAGQPMQIYSPYATAKVLGTRFTMAIEGAHTELVVQEGAVDFAHPQQIVDSYIIRGGQIAALGPQIDFIEINEPTDPVVHNFSLIDVETGEVIDGYDPIPEGAKLSLNELPKSGVNIRANVSGRVNQMKIGHSNSRGMQIEKYPPFTVAGDFLHLGGGNKALKLSVGKMRIKAIPFDREGNAGDDQSLTIHIID